MPQISVVRRRFLAYLAALAVAPAFAQPPAAKRRLGILGIGNPGGIFGGDQPRILAALADLGYVQGRNLEVIERWELESPERLSANARELADLRVDAILTEGTTCTLAAQAATRTIPILTTVGDPVGAGFAKDLHRPAGNITGLSQNRGELARKQLELVRIMLPKIDAVAVVYEEPFPGAEAIMRGFLEAAREASIKTVVLTYGSGGFGKILEEMRRRHIDAMFSLGLPAQDIEAAIRARIAVFPAGGRADVEDGALAAVENDGADDYLAIARIIDKVFRGANPADIPFSIATRYLVTVNARNAARLGIPVSPELRLRANRVIE